MCTRDWEKQARKDVNSEGIRTVRGSYGSISCPTDYPQTLPKGLLSLSTAKYGNRKEKC